MEVFIIIFMVFAAIICTFAVIAVIRDYRHEKRAAAQNTEANEQSASTEPAVEDGTTTITVASADGVWIPKLGEKTHVEKYAALSDEARARYDEIKAYAMNQKDVANRMGVRFEDFRIGKRSVTRMLIRRDMLHCEFTILQNDLSNYISESKVNVKHAAVTIKIDSVDAVEVAKNSIDIAVREIETERARRLAQQKARRRRTHGTLHTNASDHYNLD